MGTKMQPPYMYKLVTGQLVHILDTVYPRFPLPPGHEMEWTGDVSTPAERARSGHAASTPVNITAASPPSQVSFISTRSFQNT